MTISGSYPPINACCFWGFYCCFWGFLYLFKKYLQTAAYSLVDSELLYYIMSYCTIYSGIMSNACISFCWSLILRLAPPAQRLACSALLVCLGRFFCSCWDWGATWALTLSRRIPFTDSTPSLIPHFNLFVLYKWMYLYLVLSIKHSSKVF